MTAELALTTEEQAAFDRIQRWFPGAMMGPPEPRTPELRLAGRQDATGVDIDLDPGPPDVRLVDGLAFVLNAIGDVPAVWGSGDDVLWASGEPLLVVGPDGAGKTTLGQRLVLSLLEFDHRLLGYPVAPAEGGVLYVAADRPAQGARSLWRMVRDLESSSHGRLKEGLLVWRGPPPFNVAREPERLADWALQVGASVIVLDSLGFIAPELSKDETGSGIAQAFSHAVASGIEVLALHHGRKAQADNKKPTSLADVYGSRWLTSACGSVLSLWGSPGDPVLELRHLKQPAGEIGPLLVEIDRDRGAVSVVEGTDLLGHLRAATRGMSAKEAGRLMEGGSDKAREVKARRRLEGYVGRMLAFKQEGSTIRGSVKEPDRYFATPPTQEARK